MAQTIKYVFLFLFIYAFVQFEFVNSESVSLDIAASKELEDVIKSDNLVLTLRHIKSRKRHRNGIGAAETLFSVEFPENDEKFSLILDRHSKRVIVETLEAGRERKQHFTVDTLEDESVIKSLILSVNQKKPEADVTLYLDCISYGKVATIKTLREMFSGMKNPMLNVLREKKYPIEITDGHNSLTKVLMKHNCPAPPENYDDVYKYTKDEHDPNIQAYQPDPYRGDIPMTAELDDASILKALNELIRSVNNLNKQVGSQQETIDNLRRIIEDCEVCKERPPQIVRPSCATHPPGCFRGVQCHDTPSGPRCGACPRGYLGDGYTCTPGRTCAEHPCYPGVQCQDTPQGARCGQCPPGYEGNGEQCRRRSGCEYNPCHPDS